MSNVSEILKAKGGTVWSVSPQDTVGHTIKLMAEKNVGAVLVLESTKLAGIFTERDFIRHAAKHGLRPEEVLIKDMMTSHILSITPMQSTEECMSIMTTKRIRHLPVIDDGKLVGLISIGDIVNRIILDHKFAISQLEGYVTGGL